MTTVAPFFVLRSGLPADERLKIAYGLDIDPAELVEGLKPPEHDAESA